MRQIKGDSEEPEIGIEWEHGVYLSSKPSRIDFQGIREDYGGTKMEKTGRISGWSRRIILHSYTS